MKLNRTGSNWNKLERNKINENWDIIEGSYNDVVGQITDEVVGHLIDSAKLIWKEPVDTVEDLPASAEVGETRMVRKADPEGISYVYRYDGENWEKIQAIDVTLVNEVDRRLTAQLAETDEERRFESMINRKKPKQPMITIVDDDGWLGVYTKLFELAKEFNVPITSSMITGRAMGFPGDTRNPNPKYYNYHQVMEMRDSGLIEFISHSHSNINAIEATEEELRDDLKKSQSFLKKWGLNHRAIAFPGGNYNEKSLEVAKEFFDYGVGSGRFDVDGNKRIVKPPVNNYRLGRVPGDTDIKNITPYMDEAIENNGWIIITTHIDQYSSEEHIRDIITTALSKGLKFVKLEEGIKVHGNIAQFGGSNMDPETTISSSGEIISNNLGRVIIDNSREITADTPLTYFTGNAITHSMIRISQAEGFPENKTGTLITHRGHKTEEVWSYQEFIPLRETNKFIRRWDNSNKEWRNWEIEGGLLINDVNMITPDKPPSAFNVGVTIDSVNMAGSDGFPSEGIITTKKSLPSRFGRFAKQTLEVTGSYSEYKRYERKGDRWSDWARYRPTEDTGDQ